MTIKSGRSIKRQRENGMYGNHRYSNVQVDDCPCTPKSSEEIAQELEHMRHVGKQGHYRMPVGEHPPEVKAALKAACRELNLKRLARIEECIRGMRQSKVWATSLERTHNAVMSETQADAEGYRLAFIVLSRQVTHSLQETNS